MFEMRIEVKLPGLNWQGQLAMPGFEAGLLSSVREKL